MFRVFRWVLVAVVAIGAAWLLAGLPGSLSVSLSGWTVQAPTALALVALALVVLLIMAVLRLLGWVLFTPRRLGVWRARRRREAGDVAVTRTLVALAAGEDGSARRESARARALLGDTPQTLLLAAEAGRLAKREDEATALYQTLAKRPEAAVLGLRGLFRQAMNRAAWEEAAAIARRAEDVHPGGVWLREERAELAVRTGNWGQALRLAAPGAPRAAFATAASDAETDATEALRLARQAWRDNPGFAPAALAYARRLRAAGREAKVRQVIREAWRANPVPDLAAFALDPIADKVARRREAERLTSDNPNHPESLLLRARLALDAGLTGEARRHLDAARSGGLNQRRFWLLLADLEAAEGGDNEAARAALRHAAAAERDAAWRCDACGTELASWQPVCPACQTAGRITWGTPRMALVAT
jgi:HemY protein